MVTSANLANGSEFLSLGAYNEKPCLRKFSWVFEVVLTAAELRTTGTSGAFDNSVH